MHHPKARRLEVSAQNVVYEGEAGMANVGVVIDGGTAHVHRNFTRPAGLEVDRAAGGSVVEA